MQCCETGTAETATFCLSGTLTGMLYGSVSGTGFGSGSNIKCNKKVKKIKNERPTFWEIMLLLTLKRVRFC
jgi:hypothetical protein